MGSDIHAYVEQKEHDNWWHLASVSAGRNYEMFGLLAGVRGSKPLYPPKGIPDDIGWVVQEEYTLWVTDNICDCGERRCTPADAERWVRSGSSKWYDDKCHWVTHPDWHTPSWLTMAELENVIEKFDQLYYDETHTPSRRYVAIHGMMAEMERHCIQTRFVFWFDN